MRGAEEWIVSGILVGYGCAVGELWVACWWVVGVVDGLWVREI